MMTRMGTLALAGLMVASAASAKPIEQIRKKDERPLFLAVGFKKPHRPFVTIAPLSRLEPCFTAIVITNGLAAEQDDNHDKM